MSDFKLFIHWVAQFVRINVFEALESVC